MQDDLSDESLGLSDAPKHKPGKVSLEERDKRIESDVKAVLGTINGRRLFHHLKKVFGHGASPYRHGSSEQTALAIGQMECGIYIENIIKKADPNLYLKMERECLHKHYEYGETGLSHGEPSAKERKKAREVST